MGGILASEIPSCRGDVFGVVWNSRGCSGRECSFFVSFPFFVSWREIASFEHVRTCFLFPTDTPIIWSCVLCVWNAKVEGARQHSPSGDLGRAGTWHMRKT